MTNPNDFVLCIGNKGNPASLIVGKVYRKLPPEKEDPSSMVRIVDEDGSEPGGYLYPRNFFRLTAPSPDNQT